MQRAVPPDVLDVHQQPSDQEHRHQPKECGRSLSFGESAIPGIEDSQPTPSPLWQYTRPEPLLRFANHRAHRMRLGSIGKLLDQVSKELKRLFVPVLFLIERGQGL